MMTPAPLPTYARCHARGPTASSQAGDQRLVGAVSPVIRVGRPDDAPHLAAIHARSLPHEFLVRLGRGFLDSVFFPSLFASSRVTVHVAERDGERLGFIITRTGLGGILTEMLRHRPVRFVVAAMEAMIRHPSLLIECVGVVAQLTMRAFVKDKNADVAELFLMAVDPDARRWGVGRALIVHSVARLTADGVRSYRVFLHAENDPADRLYAGAGFRNRRTYRFAGRPWLEREMDLQVLEPVGEAL